MRGPLIYNAFVHLTPNHHSHGYWRTPEGRVQLGYKDLHPWVEEARLLEQARFDTLFLADVVGTYDLDYGDGTATIRNGSQFPGNDPSAIVSALGLVTEHLGLVVTSNIIQDHPFSFARKMSTLDHFTQGRVGWNIVTSYLSNGFRNFGYKDIVGHDERYEWAAEYTEVAFKLWESSWEDGAVLHDAESGAFFDPARIHRIDHTGARYRVEGPHIVEPSPQRTPVLFQAGNSAAGIAFAARNAEVSFLPSRTPEAARRDIAKLDAEVVAAGRASGSVKTLVQLSTVIGSTEQEARRKQQYLQDNISIEGLQGFYAGNTGIDLPSIDPETPLSDLVSRTRFTDHVRSNLRAAAEQYPDPSAVTWRGFLTDKALLPGRFAGTPEQIADEIERWATAGVDGFNVVPVTSLGWYQEFIEYVVPVLRKRKLMREEYEPGTLREKLFGAGPRLPHTHRARNQPLNAD
ncbi:NtaA/DmoA family FMN-dependent monooxygenase [Sciscionella marina]|uniref:NtaA/DmoA family FMN-dependent monooxygenase n=1 Tax=Sciscionella marina TaxID=508770 RepID=UPI00037BF266|nr:NtaA/DmoA family FMN-dependent monooxygenase [Sciscionella marina]